MSETFEEALYNYIIEQGNLPGLTALIGDRLFPRYLPQGVIEPTYPAVTYMQVSGRFATSHQGYMGVSMPNYQFSCWSPDYSESKAVAREVRRLAGTTDVLLGVEQNYSLRAVLPLGQADLHNAELNLFVSTIDLGLHYCETP